MAITREVENDYTREAADARRRAVSEATGVSLEHTGRYCFDPGEARGNIENFAGATQVPLGFAGPLLVNGEHAQGEFYIPLATSEGTLVASYNRGMKVAREAGGVRSTVIDDAMQRAPAFGFDSAYEARAFGAWVTEHFDAIKEQAESSTRTGRLRDIEQYSASKYRFLRFNFESGDAAGQNMSGRATAAACGWISRHYDGIRYFRCCQAFPTSRRSTSGFCAPAPWWSRSTLAMARARSLTT